MSTAPPTPPGKPFRVEIVLHPSKKAKVKPNRYKKPGPMGNTEGVVYPQTDLGPPGGNVKPPVIPETPEEKNFMEKFKDGVDDWIDKKVEGSGYSQATMIAGATGKALNELVTPTQWWEAIPGGKQVKVAGKGVKAAKGLIKGEKAAEAAKDVKKASGKGSGGRVDGKNKKDRDPCKHPNDSKKKKKYVVYKADEYDRAGNKVGTYVGRTSGSPNQSTESILNRRASGHHRKNLGPLQAIFETNSYAAVRGAEQLFKEKYSTVKQINPISPRNPRIDDYLDCAKSKGAP